MPRERSATSRSPSRSSTVARSTPATEAISRRPSGYSATKRTASSCSTVSSDSKPGPTGTRASSAIGVESVQGTALGSNADRPPRLRLLDRELPPLGQLEHRQERHADHDAVADVAQQVLEDKLRRA